MPTLTTDDGTPILVEFAPRAGVEQVSLWQLSPEELAARSEQALDQAMGAIRHMAGRMSALRDAIPAEFSEVEIEFGIKLDYQAGALLAKAGAEGSLKVTLTWKRKDKPKKAKPAQADKGQAPPAS